MSREQLQDHTNPRGLRQAKPSLPSIVYPTHLKSPNSRVSFLRKETVYDMRRTEFQKFLSQREQKRKNHQSSEVQDKQSMAQTTGSKIRFFDTFNTSMGRLSGSDSILVVSKKPPHESSTCKKQDIYPEQTHKVAAVDRR